MNDRHKVAQFITTTLSNRYHIVDNMSGDKKLIAGQFPDVLVYKKDSTADRDLLFVMKIENGGELIDSLPQWKELTTAPSTFYIVVPQPKLDDAKKLASATGIKAKFAWYRMEKGNVAQVIYE
jgi:hypothetical protein